MYIKWVGFCLVLSEFISSIMFRKCVRLIVGGFLHLFDTFNCQLQFFLFLHVTIRIKTIYPQKIKQKHSLPMESFYEHKKKNVKVILFFIFYIDTCYLKFVVVNKLYFRFHLFCIYSISLIISVHHGLS